ncbi:Lipoxygenase [Quillaja saponaria]|uniref:Lipoxygenase n=1 Tax=Quillaja saponaria TaxID=32244 RepID=A0AAD7VM71_QUISA|nr:Lipoxygenase [Quillaja saponaria]
MLKPHVHQSQYSTKALFLLQKHYGSSTTVSTCLPAIWSKPSLSKKHRYNLMINCSSSSGLNIPFNMVDVDEKSATAAESVAEQVETIKVKAIVTVKLTVAGFFSSFRLNRGIDDITDLLGKSLLLEIVSTELDSKTGLEKDTVQSYAHKGGRLNGSMKYETDIEVPIDFGDIGAILVENEHHKEMFVEDIVLDGFPQGPITFSCSSWVHSKFDNPIKRMFFTNKCYLPSNTPTGLKKLRANELVNLRGDGQGERKSFERIYDYDVYNDIGDPDKSLKLRRPALGGKEHPYPRRCRTGRPPSEADPTSEKRSGRFYVPRDECFSEIKQLTFNTKTLYSVLHAVVPSLGKAIEDNEVGFPYFNAIDSLFSIGVDLPLDEKEGLLHAMMPRIVKTIAGSGVDVLRFELPETMNRDKFFWFRDDEFARQTLAGLNPCSITTSHDIYGPAESAITTEIIQEEIGGIVSVEEAIKQKKLFILDYHDILLPFVSKVRKMKGTTLYGSRTLFFLTSNGTLRPLAIELTRPPMDGKDQWKQVFTPCWHSTCVWLWRIAKAHVLAHDSGYHQLVSHWLRTHAATEPYVIATNRQLSAMHPIYKLLHPHFRYTLEINALAREALINAGGTIETSFSPGIYSMELCSVAYDVEWRFDMQGLPADLINRGMAVKDPFAPHGVKLTIEDYPYANDGLLLWDTIKQWVTDYVNHYYPEPTLVESDEELQAWWTEIRTVGHADKKDELWWPVLKTSKDLIEIITTIVWITSGHHASVNFGQYAYGGYFPNRPTIARTNMPTEDPSEESWEKFKKKPETALLQCFPSQLQATKVMAVLDILSNHSPDEEYLGEKMEPSWAEDPTIKLAFERFNERLKKLERIIDKRNKNEKLKNRNGAGVMPYELLKPFSKPGVTGKGIPYSISI